MLREMHLERLRRQISDLKDDMKFMKEHKVESISRTAGGEIDNTAECYSRMESAIAELERVAVIVEAGQIFIGHRAQEQQLRPMADGGTLRALGRSVMIEDQLKAARKET